MNSLDVRAAFLQGKGIERIVYLKPPAEANADGKLWMLKKSIYGLNDAARMWYFTVWEMLEKFGCKRSSVDYGVFTWLEDRQLAGILETHVDDFMWSGTKSFERNVIKPLCDEIEIGQKSSTDINHLGLHISQYPTHIELDQVEYIEKVQPISLSRDRQCVKKEYCTENESYQFRQLVGKLNWVASQTRPDISFDVRSLSSVMRSPMINDILLANKVLRKLKEQPLKLKFPKFENLNDLQILCYADASLANLVLAKSTCGFILLAVAPNSICYPIVWKSNTIKRVVRSTLAAEANAMVDALDSSFFIVAMISEMMNLSERIPIIAYTDSDQLHKNCHSTKMCEEQRPRIEIGIIKEMLTKGELTQLNWVPKSEMIADSLTKHGASSLTLTRILENGCFA